MIYDNYGQDYTSETEIMSLLGIASITLFAAS